MVFLKVDSEAAFAEHLSLGREGLSDGVLAVQAQWRVVLCINYLLTINLGLPCLSASLYNEIESVASFYNGFLRLLVP